MLYANCYTGDIMVKNSWSFHQSIDCIVYLIILFSSFLPIWVYDTSCICSRSLQRYYYEAVFTKDLFRDQLRKETHRGIIHSLFNKTSLSVDKENVKDFEPRLVFDTIGCMIIHVFVLGQHRRITLSGHSILRGSWEYCSWQDLVLPSLLHFLRLRAHRVTFFCMTGQNNFFLTVLYALIFM